MGKPAPWQRRSWARRRLWDLVVSKFVDQEVKGPWEVTLNRQELIENGVFGGLDEHGAPQPPELETEKYHGGER